MMKKNHDTRFGPAHCAPRSSIAALERSARTRIRTRWLSGLAYLAGAGPACLGFATLGCGVGEESNEPGPRSSVGVAEDALTIDSVTDPWGPGAVIDTCFLATGLDAQKQQIRDNVHRTWEFVANLTVNWLDSCPATGSLVRIAISTNTAQGQAGWTVGHGVHSKKGPDATNGASIQTCGSMGNCPSSKYYLSDPPSDPDRVAYLAVHEWGHVLGFDEELFHPNATGSCSAGTAEPNPSNIAVTPYDQNSIMNYCNSFGNDKGWIDEDDVTGIQSLYGLGKRYVAVVSLLTS